jgi:glutathione S-transferase
MRPWLALKHSGLKFTEEIIRLDTPTSKKEIKKVSSTGRVPVLHHGSLRVSDSLAICEYVAELAPQSGLWPEDSAHRAVARALVCEMHSSFQALRSQLPMNLQLRMTLSHLSPETIVDIQRICHIWDHSLRTNKGPFLLGEQFSILDAFFAPVVLRFESYQIAVTNPNAKRYMASLLKDDAVQLWIREAKKEKTQIFRFN